LTDNLRFAGYSVDTGKLMQSVDKLRFSRFDTMQSAPLKACREIASYQDYLIEADKQSTSITISHHSTKDSRIDHCYRALDAIVVKTTKVTQSAPIITHSQ
jgi:hypothetical protein